MCTQALVTLDQRIKSSFQRPEVQLTRQALGVPNVVFGARTLKFIQEPKPLLA
jgi:hypothetical protein